MQLVISYRMNAEYMCEFTNEEFCSGFEEMGVDSIEGLKEKVPVLRNLMKDECTERDISQHVCVCVCVCAFNSHRRRLRVCV